MRIANTVPLFTLTLAACAVGTDDDTEGRNANLVASVDRPSGSHVEFLAMDEGGVLVAEQWQLGNQPTLPEEMARTVDPRDYYRALTGEEAPDDLAAAVEASDTTYRRFAPSELVLGDGPRPSKLWALTADEFHDAYCGWDLEHSDDWCHLDATVETKHKKDDIKGMAAIVCSSTGDVDLRIAIRRPRHDWERESHDVWEGGCARYTISSNRDFDGEAWVMKVDPGDRYHHAGMRCWNVGLLTCPVFRPPLP